jgi:hypothetical protein
LSGNDEASGEVVASGGVVRIYVNRKLFAMATLFLGALTCAGLARAITAGNLLAALIVLGVLGGPWAFYARGLLRRSPAIVIDRRGLGGFRVRRSVPWTDIGDIYLSHGRGLFGDYHHLVITARQEGEPPLEDELGLVTSRIPTEKIEIPLDQLATPWREVAALVQEQLGRSVSVKKETWLSGIRAK